MATLTDIYLLHFFKWLYAKFLVVLLRIPVCHVDNTSGVKPTYDLELNSVNLMDTKLILIA